MNKDEWKELDEIELSEDKTKNKEQPKPKQGMLERFKGLIKQGRKKDKDESAASAAAPASAEADTRNMKPFEPPNSSQTYFTAKDLPENAVITQTTPAGPGVPATYAIFIPGEVKRDAPKTQVDPGVSTKSADNTDRAKAAAGKRPVTKSIDDSSKKPRAAPATLGQVSSAESSSAETSASGVVLKTKASNKAVVVAVKGGVAATVVAKPTTSVAEPVDDKKIKEKEAQIEARLRKEFDAKYEAAILKEQSKAKPGKSIDEVRTEMNAMKDKALKDYITELEVERRNRELARQAKLDMERQQREAAFRDQLAREAIMREQLEKEAAANAKAKKQKDKDAKSRKASRKASRKPSKKKAKEKSVDDEKDKEKEKKDKEKEKKEKKKKDKKKKKKDKKKNDGKKNDKAAVASTDEASGEDEPDSQDAEEWEPE